MLWGGEGKVVEWGREGSRVGKEMLWSGEGKVVEWGREGG